MTELAKGDRAPAFTLTDSAGKTVSLKDFAGGKVILYFYPAAMTPGCTIEATDFSAAVPDLRSASYTVVGVSPDPPEKLARFVAHNKLTLTLLSDPGHEVLEAYGAWGGKSLWGKVYTGVVRSTFVIDVDDSGEGTVVEAQYNVKATGHVNRLRTLLGV